MDTQNQLPQLIKKESTYKLIVPENVEEKIRYLIRKYPHTEWSGVLFIKYTGTFENKDLTVICQDIFPMDLGTSGWTEFKMNEDVTAYMAENIELFDCELALVHSHHTLGAFFSGQDKLMLQQEGDDTNCFVSLIVDTKGEYKAAITRKIKQTSEITIKSIGNSYEFFGEGSVELPMENTEETKKTITKEYIEYYMLDVERHVVDNPLSYLDDRFEEIVSKKPVKAPMTILGNDFDEDKGYFSSLLDKAVNKKPKASQLELFDRESTYAKAKVPVEDDDIKEECYYPNIVLVENAVRCLLYCMLCPDESLSIECSSEELRNRFIEIFNAKYELANAPAFQEWKDFIIDYIFNNFVNADSEVYDYQAIYCGVADALVERLSAYKDNPFIKEYLDSIETYMF